MAEAATFALTEEQFRRYARHLILDQVGEEGQARLLQSRVLVVGAGGLGSPRADVSRRRRGRHARRGR